MRGLIWLIPAFIVGFLLGGVPARRDLAKATEALAQAQDELAEAQKRGGRRSSLPIPLPALNDALSAPEDDPEEGEENTENNDQGDGAELVEMPSDGPPPSRNSAKELEEGFQAAVDAQRVRASQSRAALAEQAGLSDEDLQEFDQIVADMNDQLAAVAPDLIDLALSTEEGEEPNVRDTLGVAHDVTGILYDGQAALEELVGAEALPDVEDASKQIWNYVDLETFGPALEAAAEAEGSADAGRTPRAPGRR